MKHIVFAIALFATLTATAGSFKLKSFQGKIHNHSRFSSDKIILKISVLCEYFVSTNRRGTCGSQSANAVIDDNGNYTVPQIIITSEGNNWKAHFHMTYELTVKSETEIITPHQTYNSSFFGEDSTEEFFMHMEDLTLFNLKKSVVKYQVPNMTFPEWMIINRSGDFYKSWLGMWIDLKLGAETFAIEMSMRNPVPNEIFLKEAIILVIGDLPANQEFIIDARSSTLPERTLHFTGAWSFENFSYPEEILNPVIGPESN